MALLSKSRVSIALMPRACRPIDDKAWHLPPRTQAEIAALTTWCHVYRQQQEPLDTTVHTEEETENEDDDDDDDSVDDEDDNFTNICGLLTANDSRNVISTFLDALAEIICREKHASFVTCTSLFEDGDECTIFIARNAKWTDADKTYLGSVVTALEEVASHKGTVCYKSVVTGGSLTLTCNFYKSRLSFHTTQVLQYLAVESEHSDLVEAVRNLLTKDVLSHSPVKYVNDLFDSPQLETIINRICKEGQAKNLVRHLRYIHRPWNACTIFGDTAMRLPSFQTVRIILLPGYAKERISPDPTVVGSMQARMRTLAPTFFREAKKPKWIHAEIRMATYLLSHSTHHGSRCYLGISKRTCFCCGRVLEDLGLFTTRGNHGKAYAQWTLPASLSVEPRYAGMLDQVVENLKANLVKVLQSSASKPHAGVKESSLTTPVAEPGPRSDIFRKFIPDPRDQQREADWLRRSISHAFEPESSVVTTFPNEDGTAGLPHPYGPGQLLAQPPRCASCATESDTLRRCTKCKHVAYCDIDCSKRHWPSHKYECQLGRPLDAADDLVLACRKDAFPQDDDVHIAFGFKHFVSSQDRQRLFTIYRGLVQKHGVGDEELRDAWRSNKLKEFLSFRAAQVLDISLQTDLRWLQRQSNFAANSIADFATVIYHTARQRLNPRDREMPFNQLEPLEKRQAFLFYGQILNGYMPGVDEDLWLYLGFCAPKDAEETNCLAAAYRALVDACQFDEFWTAMRDSKMPDLFAKYGLSGSMSTIPSFKILMSNVARWHYSVWDLKKYIRSTDIEPSRSVQVDYGFIECQDARERITLRGMYADYFDQGHDALLLHDSCIKGRIAPFLESILGSLPLPTSRLNNPYPLPTIPGITYQCYDGIVAENVTACPASQYELVCRMVEQDGTKEFVLPIPDDNDFEVKNRMDNKAAYTTGRLYTRKRVFEGKLMEGWHVAR
ncbi:hypothetical protein BKA63DRAFT_486180 [Paraphoma chrysanthemicola]|nr:hypothetical protein BKA63DRAFT_486180 [Paraphoma chrysanthemicola]